MRVCFSRTQVLNNVAQIVLEETAPGSTVWLKWRNVLHVVDIVCCCFILVPIIWSIRNLRDVGDFRRQAAATSSDVRVTTLASTNT